jgi:hypothetical protein
MSRERVLYDDETLLRCIDILTSCAKRYPIVQAHLKDQAARCDSYPTQTPGAAVPIADYREPRVCKNCNGAGCDNCGPVTSDATSRAALMKVRFQADIDQLTDDREAIYSLAISLSRLLETGIRQHGPGIIKPTERVCDASGREGAIEWADPMCGDYAAKSVLCARCYQRERRWRLAHNLTTRQDEAA